MPGRFGGHRVGQDPETLESGRALGVDYMTPSDISYNRKGKKIDPSLGSSSGSVKYPAFPHSHLGFVWNDGDDGTLK